MSMSGIGRRLLGLGHHDMDVDAPPFFISWFLVLRRLVALALAATHLHRRRRRQRADSLHCILNATVISSWSKVSSKEER